MRIDQPKIEDAREESDGFENEVLRNVRDIWHKLQEADGLGIKIENELKSGKA